MATKNTTEKAPRKSTTAPQKSAAPKADAVALITPVYTMAGKKAADVTLPASVFGVRWNGDLVHQVTIAMQANARTPVAHTKNRGEVRGGGKKPWKQKGTGRARHGSIRSPIWRGGGVTFGPRNDKDYSQKINKKMKTKALSIVLSRKFKDGEILFIDSLSFGGPKTSDAKKALTLWGGIKGFEGVVSKKNNCALIATPQMDSALQKSFNNFGNISIDEVRNLNPVEVLRYKYLIISKPALAIATLEGRQNKKREQK